MSKTTIELVSKLINRYKKNIEFFKQRIELQSQPNYTPWAKSGGQWSERQYYQHDIEAETEKLNKAETKLSEVLENSLWVCTDPDNNQYRMNDGNDLMTGKVFVFREDDTQKTIDIRDFTDEQKISVAKSFDYLYYIESGELRDSSGGSLGNAILAECLFESL